MTKTVCGICGAAMVPHEDADGSWRMVEDCYFYCNSGRYGIALPQEVPDDYERPSKEDGWKAMTSGAPFR